MHTYLKLIIKVNFEIVGHREELPKAILLLPNKRRDNKSTRGNLKASTLLLCH